MNQVWGHSLKPGPEEGVGAESRDYEGHVTVSGIMGTSPGQVGLPGVWFV